MVNEPSYRFKIGSFCLFCLGGKVGNPCNLKTITKEDPRGVCLSCSILVCTLGLFSLEILVQSIDFALAGPHEGGLQREIRGRSTPLRGICPGKNV